MTAPKKAMSKIRATKKVAKTGRISRKVGDTDSDEMRGGTPKRIKRP